MAICYTIGAMMVFPGNRIQGEWTINQARGCLKKSRTDSTLRSSEADGTTPSEQPSR